MLQGDQLDLVMSPVESDLLNEAGGNGGEELENDIDLNLPYWLCAC